MAAVTKLSSKCSSAWLFSVALLSEGSWAPDAIHQQTNPTNFCDLTAVRRAVSARRCFNREFLNLLIYTSNRERQRATQTYTHPPHTHVLAQARVCACAGTRGSRGNKLNNGTVAMVIMSWRKVSSKKANKRKLTLEGVEGFRCAMRGKRGKKE